MPELPYPESWITATTKLKTSSGIIPGEDIYTLTKYKEINELQVAMLKGINDILRYHDADRISPNGSSSIPETNEIVLSLLFFLI